MWTKFVELPKPILSLVTTLVVLGLGTVHYLSGNEITFFIFYGVPVVFLTWYGSRTSGHILAVFCAVVWLVAINATGKVFSSPAILIWNTCARYLFFLFIVESLSTIRHQLDESRRKVRALEGIIHICNACKRIRDREDFWNQIEDYIEDHFDVEVERKLCPDCAKKHYIQTMGR